MSKLASRHYVSYSIHVGVVDSSGLRLWLVPKPRLRTSGVINAGLTVSVTEDILPPGLERFYHFGICPKECLNKVSNTILSFIMVDF